MGNLLRSVASRTPHSITEMLRSTRIHSLYHRILIRTTSTVEINVECGGEVESLSVPEDSVYTNEGVFEPILSEVLCNRLSSSSVFYDVGSQYGYFISLAQTAGVRADAIYGFDINPFALHVLSQNFSESDITITDTVVAADSDEASISLDDFAASSQPPTAVKIDVEGAELNVLRGMESILAQNQPELFIEIHPAKLSSSGQSGEQIIGHLQDYGYSLQVADHRNGKSEWEDVSGIVLPDDQTYLLWAPAPDHSCERNKQ